MAATVPDSSISPPRPGASGAPHMVLDARHLGRPVHLLPVFTARWHDDFAALLRNSLNRRYGVVYEVTQVTLTRVDEPAGSGRWHTFLSAAGQIGFSIGRPLLLGILDLRYGARTPPPAAVPPPPEEDAAAIAELTGELTPEPEAPPAAPAVAPAPLPAALGRPTATEERLADSLGGLWVTALSACIDALAPARAGFAGIAPAHHFAAVIAAPPGPGTWTLEVTLKDPLLPDPAQVWFTLSPEWMTRLLHNLTPAREKKPRESRAVAPPLAATLQITLLARLLRRETSLGQIVDLSVGDVIPIRLGPTEVLIDDALLFTGALVEQQGRLCLTAFRDLD